eukprot:229762-Chlamydomonas_euryale.AAC.1
MLHAGSGTLPGGGAGSTPETDVPVWQLVEAASLSSMHPRGERAAHGGRGERPAHSSTYPPVHLA